VDSLRLTLLSYGNWRLAFEGEDAFLIDCREEVSTLFNPSHPEVIKDCLGDMTVKEAVRRLGVTPAESLRILNSRGGISAGMSVRLTKAIRYTSPDFWLKTQLNYDLWKA
jgi:addiction module HigA family antidote